jgi:hypothetical protein
MKLTLPSKLIILCFLQITFLNQAFAGLIISPTRVVFEDRNRSASVVIINSGSTTATYRLEMINKRQLENGAYQTLDMQKDDISDLFLARDMIRYSPRQVTLKPRERQTVRLSLRKPANLASGEYRSHLSFTQLPSPQMLQRNPNSPKVQIFMLIGFTIPVQVLQGKVSFQSKITQAQLIQIADKTGKTSWQMQIDIEREGDFSSVGKLSVHWKPDTQTQYKELKFLNNATLYRETKKRRFSLMLPEETPKSGIYKVVYETSKPFKKRILDEITVAYPSP